MWSVVDYQQQSGWYRPKPASGGLDPATTAWVNAVVTAGGTVSGTQQTNVDNLIKGLKNATNGNLFTILDRLWIFAGESVSQQANIDLIHLATNTNNGLVLSAGGYLGNGSTQYLDTGFNPSTAGGNYSQNSANLGTYIDTFTSPSGRGFMGIGTGVNYSYLASGTFAAEVNGGSFPTFTTTANGLYVLYRSASTGFSVGRNAGTASVLTDTSTTMANSTIFVSAQNNGSGTAINFSSDKIKAAWIGGGLTAAQAIDLANAINSYMTAWSVNTF